MTDRDIAAVAQVNRDLDDYFRSLLQEEKL